MKKLRECLVCGENKAKITAKYCIECSLEIDQERRELYKIANRQAVINVTNRKRSMETLEEGE